MPSFEWRIENRRIILPVIVQSVGVISRTSPIRALFDTGATKSAITSKVVNELNLFPIGESLISFGGGEERRKNYIFQIGIWDKQNNAQYSENNPWFFEVTEGFELTNKANFEVLIGMDLIKFSDWKISKTGKVSCTI